jgi:hypothetical protein
MLGIGDGADRFLEQADENHELSGGRGREGEKKRELLEPQK